MSETAVVVVKGIKTVLVAGLKFSNEASHANSFGQCNTAAQGLADFYRRNSRNMLNLKVEVKLIDVPFPGDANSVLSKGGPYVKQQFPGKDIYVIVSKFVSGDHSGNGFAYVMGTLTRDVEHECGHVLGLAHAGAYSYTGKGTTYDQYGDGLSVMSRFASNYLTSPAYVYLGWMPESEIVRITDANQLPATFNLKRINNYGAAGTSVVIFDSSILKNKGGRNAYLSFPQHTKFWGSKPFAVLHLVNGEAIDTGHGMNGGSAKIKTFGSSFYDSIFTGLNMQIQPGTSDTQLIIKVSLQPPATAYPVEVVPADDTDADDTQTSVRHA